MPSPFLAWYLITSLLSIGAFGSNSLQVVPVESCKLRSYWLKYIKLNRFDPTNDCRDLNEILRSTIKPGVPDFCKADPDSVMRYINASLLASGMKARNTPRPCEIRQWYYESYGGQLKEPFCENATKIAIEVKGTGKKDAAQTQPYFNLVHSARSTCHMKLKSDLQSIGNPDVAGIGVLVSHVVIHLLLLFFQIAAKWTKLPLATRLLSRTSWFFTVLIVLALSIPTASLITFLNQRSRSIALFDNFGYNNFYVNTTLALAPALSIVPAVVLVLMPPEVSLDQSGEKINLWDNNVKNARVLRKNRWTVVILYLFSISITWYIWSAGIRGQYYSTRIVFGGAFILHVSDFLYKDASKYVLSVYILITAFPIAAMIGFIPLRAKYNKASLEQYVEILRDTFRILYFLFSCVQLITVIYIRGQSILQAEGRTSEIDWGFGQILVLFTWTPLVLSIVEGIWVRLRSNISLITDMMR